MAPPDLRGRSDHHDRVVGAGRRVRPSRRAAHRDGRRRRLDARWCEASRARSLLPPTDFSCWRAPDDAQPSLFLVDPQAAGVSLTQKMSISSDAEYRVDLDKHAAGQPPAIESAAPAAGWVTWEAGDGRRHDPRRRPRQRRRRHAFDHHGRSTARTGTQFDKPLGAFQVIAHYMWDANTIVDGGRTLNTRRWWAGRTADPSTASCRCRSCSCARRTVTSRDGAADVRRVGFTLEYDIQLYFRRAKQLQISWWDDRYLEELIGHRQPPPPPNPQHLGVERHIARLNFEMFGRGAGSELAVVPRGDMGGIHLDDDALVEE